MLRTVAGRLARRPWRFVFPGLLFFFFFYSLSHRTGSRTQGPVHKAKTKSFFPPLETKAANSIELDYCKNFPTKLLEEVQVVLKVASDGAHETKAHLNTVSSCITNLIIVGDRDERLGDRQVIDILAELPKSYQKDNLDFEAYVAQKKAHEGGETVKGQQRSFKLDRFKYLPMVDKAYITNPTAKWFVFVESDVYFFWDTLFRLLSQLDPSEPHYMGEPHKGSEGRQFAYGGAGIVLSQGLVKKLIPAKTVGSTEIPRENRLSVRYENWVKEEQRGDAVLAYAIQNATGHKIAPMHPTFASDKVKDVVTTKERWCVPMLSLHQVKPQQMEDLWKWERTRPYNTKPFTYSSFLSYTHAFLSQGPSREWWDNLSTAPVPNDRPAHHNAGSCGSECANDNNCLQWSYSQTVCRHADYIKLGDAVDRENGGQGEFVSGWDTAKLRAMGFGVEGENGQREFYAGCEEATWLTPKAG
ncbi:glycosyltransferase family 31 protein [Bipolaris victoriae FI3]|uniref:N-acetylgalactosaminide beta-1,3-galactosyltransferase n=2 Tax=Bipolaris TaxID=33194 RepID=W6YT70_COCC2|nr:glycosyltransferase family 31 protein [Bipolaris zeicola 26-R-13]XP_014562330.1 glycosyltransferase family 31 protein [Bipolaris victoriae FI3]EUC34681.1 glycosyltransferase family 31 protein [Bipolaris zeicola 26-R-13]